MATIADVAREAGVSVSTVSHVVNGTRRVSPATASAVKAVIDAVGYHPNVVARSLKTASTQSVGIAISAIANPYFSDIICAIETECARLGMMVFLSDTQDDPVRELAVLTALHQRRVDGVILAPSADPERRALVYLHATRLPCVLVDRTPDPSFDQVGVNNREAMRELVDYVAGLGHRRIGYIGGHPGFETTLERIIGYRDSLAATGPLHQRASSRHRQRLDGERGRGDPRAAVAARAADRDRHRQQYGDDRGDAGHSSARADGSRRHFNRRLRRFRVGGLFRAAAHFDRAALRGDRQAGGVPADGADRRARRRSAHGAPRRRPQASRLLCEAAMNAPAETAPAAARHDRRRQALRRRAGAPRRGLRSAIAGRSMRCLARTAPASRR